MPVAGLDPVFNGYRLIQLSDLHVGSPDSESYLDHCVELISAEQPDLVVVTGDLIHSGGVVEATRVAGLLARIRVRDGVAVALGNHDYRCSIPGQADTAVSDKVTALLERRSGVGVLRNACYCVRRDDKRFHVVGLDEYWSSNYQPEQAFRDLPAGEAAVALIHNPDAFPDLLQWPAQWFLAGHTHGGQVNVPGYGPPILPVRHRQFAAGHYRLGDKNLYVNPGLGWLQRIRFNVRPEITVFELQSA